MLFESNSLGIFMKISLSIKPIEKIMGKINEYMNWDPCPTTLNTYVPHTLIPYFLCAWSKICISLNILCLIHEKDNCYISFENSCKRKHTKDPLFAWNVLHHECCFLKLSRVVFCSASLAGDTLKLFREILFCCGHSFFLSFSEVTES